jgi:CDP-diacylglycerol--serine O-phosphatidyltransferase
MKHIPNLITVLNISAGFIALIFAMDGNIITASWLILAAMVFDFLDGFTARMLKAYSDMGRELDSLGDLVSFGVAPALLIIKLIAPVIDGIEAETEGFWLSLAKISVFIPVLMPVCAALRLAKFNTDPTQSKSFKGLPTPANAIGVISLVIVSEYTSLPVLKSLSGSLPALVAYSLILSLLMVTRIPLLSLKFSNLKFKGNEGRYILISLILMSFIILGLNSAILIIPVYIMVSLVNKPVFESAVRNRL